MPSLVAGGSGRRAEPNRRSPRLIPGQVAPAATPGRAAAWNPSDGSVDAPGRARAYTLFLLAYARGLPAVGGVPQKLVDAGGAAEVS